MSAEIQTIITIAGLAGATLTFAVNIILGLVKDWLTRGHENSIQNKEHNQKRIELQVSFLREKLDDVEKQIDQVTSSSLSSHGYSLGLSADSNSESEASYFTNLLMLFEGGYARGELAYLKALCGLYEVDSQLLKDIKSCDERVQEILTSDVSTNIDENLVNHRELISILIEIRVLFRLTLHRLIDKLLKPKAKK